MSERIDPATEPDSAVGRFGVAWGIALGIGFVFGLVGLVTGPVPAIGMMVLATIVVGAIGQNNVNALVVAVSVLVIGLIGGLLGGQQDWVNGPISFLVGLAGFIALGLTLHRLAEGRSPSIIGILMTGALPFSLNGLRAYETMGAVGL